MPGNLKHHIQITERNAMIADCIIHADRMSRWECKTIADINAARVVYPDMRRALEQIHKRVTGPAWQ